jgi:hypothetical protein
MSNNYYVAVKFFLLILLLSGVYQKARTQQISKWMNDHINELPVPKEEIQKYLKERTW